MTIAEELNKKKEKSLYLRIAEELGVSYGYVAQIAVGTRSGKKGKGKLIKDAFLKEVERLNSLDQ